MATLTPNPSLVEKIVYANRILYDQGIVDGLGHVSVRDDQVPGVFLLSCNRAPALVVYRAIYAEINAKLQARSMGMGEVNFLTPQEAGMAATANDSQIGRSWDLWCRRIGPVC